MSKLKSSLLISGLGGSLFPYLHEQLRREFNIFYLDSDVTLKNLYPELNFYPAPLVTSDEYFGFVRDAIKANKIDFYIPLIDEELIAAKELEGFMRVKVVTPSIDFCRLTLDKSALMMALSSTGISCIKSITGDVFADDFFPAFVKPIFGRGSRGIRKIANSAELDAYYLLETYKPNDVLIQELVLGTEYTVGVTMNNLNDLLEVSTKRIIKKKGITIIAETERNEAITTCAKAIAKEFKPCGPFNIQLYITPAGEIKIFEINPRFSTTTIMSYAAGIDVISLYSNWHNRSYFDAPLQPKDGLILHRRWENVFYEK